jgi:two-component system LytT family sensor kinase
MNKLIGNRWFQYAMPLVIWFLLLILPFLPLTSNSIPPEIHHRFLVNILTSNLLLLCVFYLHTYIVYPLLNKNMLWYVLSLIILLGAYWLGWFLLKNDPRHDHFMMMRTQGNINFPKPNGLRINVRRFGGPDFIPILSPLVAILCSFCYRVILDNRARQQLLKERETIHLKSELNFLRSQISPHFMFNILNNLVSLARKKSDDLEPAIVNLSQLMRYMLYESDDHRVILSKEIEYLKSYINLQMLRFGSNVKVNIDITGNTDQYTIEPMLLIPFVENAFKHGTGMVDDPIIAISLNIDADTHLMRFIVINEVSQLDVSKDNSSGIGISNVQRRLAILYPGKHELHILNENNSFTIDLSISLSN